MPAVALLSWPIIAVAIFVALGPGRGMIWTLLLGWLFLPEDYGFDLPALPAYDKYSVISLSLVLGILVVRNRAGAPPELVDRRVRNLISLILFLLFAGMLITVVNNPDPLVRGGRFQSGHGIRDFISFAGATLITLTPFLLARRWLADPEMHAELLRAIVILALVYSLFVLFERRMSPQLNRWIYGLTSDAWIQHIRGGGFRPMVFLSHGLEIGYFYFCAVLAAVGLARGATNSQERAFYAISALWIFLVLALSRNMGALMLAVLFGAPLLFLSRRGLLWVVTATAIFFSFYPVIRQANIVPIERFVSVVAVISQDRAQSFDFRLRNEDGLLQRAAEKPVFGWGGWGRSRVIDEQGRDQSVTDGGWIIRLGQFGWVGYLGFFGGITLPLLLLWRRKNIPMATFTLAICTTANLVYLIPNASLGPVVWLIAGTTVGFLQYARSGDASEPQTAPTEASPRTTVYSRFPTTSGSRSYSRNLER